VSNSYLERLENAVRRHEQWRVNECLNLAAAENRSSKKARSFLQTDLGNRYSNPRLSNFHRGAQFLDEVQELAEEAARKVFNAQFADVRSISGHLAAMAVLMALTKRGDKILSLSPEDGGYPGTTQRGLGKFLGLEDRFFPYQRQNMNIDVEETIRLIAREKPRLVVFGASYILFPQPTKAISSAAQDAVCVYDGSHVLGLIAGGEFQDPLREGCSLLMGSTHKSFPGPQGGIILSNDERVFEEVARNMVPGIVDNVHLHRIAALALSLVEMLEFGKAYATAVVENARTLGKNLERLNVKVKAAHLGYSSSHQVHLDYDAKKREIFADKLEAANIIIDNGGRLGVAEATRLGMGTKEMERVAELVSLIVLGKESPNSVKRKVRSLVADFREPRYVLK